MSVQTPAVRTASEPRRAGTNENQHVGRPCQPAGFQWTLPRCEPPLPAAGRPPASPGLTGNAAQCLTPLPTWGGPSGWDVGGHRAHASASLPALAPGHHGRGHVAPVWPIRHARGRWAPRPETAGSGLSQASGALPVAQGGAGHWPFPPVLPLTGPSLTVFPRERTAGDFCRLRPGILTHGKRCLCSRPEACWSPASSLGAAGMV